MEWQNKFYCEIDPFCRRILKYYWPDAEEYSNIKEFEATKFRGIIEIITGGFPCQPFSVAGQRRGTDDNRYLWPEILRIIRAIQPRWVLAENVPGLLNWKKGAVFHQVQTDLEASGYKVQPVVLPACALGAPHLRYRLRFIAYTNEFGQLGHKETTQKFDAFDGRKTCSDFNVHGPRWTSTYSDGQRLEGTSGESVSSTGRRFEWSSSIPVWDNWPTQSPVCSRDDGLSRELDGITFSEWRAQSIHALGNAIVPQVALQIFRTIEEMHTKLT